MADSAKPIIDDDVFAEIDGLRASLTADVERLRAMHTKPKDYAQEITALAAKRFDKQIHEIGKRITAANRNHELLSPCNLELWHELANALTLLSEHPDKKVASLVISPRNHLVSWGVNRIPSNIVRKNHYYEPGSRSHYLYCAEPDSIGKVLDMQLEKQDTRSRPQRARDADVRRRVSSHIRDIRNAAAESTQLKDHLVIVTIPSCESCSRVIAAANPAVVSFGEAAFKTTRDLTKGYRVLSENGVKIINWPDFAPS